MEVDMPQRSASNFYATFERSLDVLEIVEPFTAENIDEQMCSGKTNAFTFDEEVFSTLVRYVRVLIQIFLLGGA